MVVVPEPAVKGAGALVAVAVDRAIGPATQHRANEALGLAVGLRTVCTGAQVADAEGATRERVHHGPVTGAVVGEQLLHGHAVALKEGDSAPEKGDHRRGPTSGSCRT